MREALLGLRADHGTGDPEASDEALRTVLHALPAAGRRQVGDFRGRFVADTRIVILVTDELPGGFDDTFTPGVDDASAAAVAADAAALGVLISAVYVPTARFFVNGDPAVIEIMRNYAIATGGLYHKTRRDGQGTANALSDVIASCGRRPGAGAPAPPGA